MSHSIQKQELGPKKLKRLAREATAQSFARALRSKFVIVYKEGNTLIERQPDGTKIKLASLSHEKKNITTRFKLK